MTTHNTTDFDAQWMDALASQLEADKDLEHEQAIEAGTDPEDDSWLIDWTLKHITRLEAQRQRAQEQADRRIRECDRLEAYLRETYGERLRNEVMRQIQAAGGKKKSIDFSMGRVGFRTVPARQKVEINEEEALPWVMDEYPEAIRYSISKTPLKKAIEQGQEIPGVQVTETPAYEKFYVGDMTIEESE